VLSTKPANPLSGFHTGEFTGSLHRCSQGALAHAHDAVVMLYDAWSNLPNRHLQARVANIATTLSEVETRLAEVKVIQDPQPQKKEQAQ
jgi:hypothetical protein